MTIKEILDKIGIVKFFTWKFYWTGYDVEQSKTKNSGDDPNKERGTNAG